LAEKYHSLRIPVAEPGIGAAGAFAAGHGLFVDPGGASPPEFALAAGQPPVTAKAQANRTPYRAAATALGLHLAVIALFIARLGPPHRLGTEQGLPESVNVSLTSAAELDRRHSSASLRDQSARPGPLGPGETPAAESLQVLTPPQPPAQEAEAAQPPPQPKPNANRAPSFDASAFINMASAEFSAELNQAVSAAEARARRQAAARRSSTASGRVRSTRPGATHIGKSDEFEREVIWALGATVPEGNGKWGSTIVTFTVSAAGQPDGLRLLKSSGDNWLDGAALMAVKQARIPSPPPGLPAGDRTFVIEYLSLPTRSR
jgi:periplasmic protein TonB